MAKKGGGEELVALLGLGAAFVGLAWLVSGRGQNNSPLIPDRLEDKIDLVVESLNKQFGHEWVTYGLNILQAHIERTLPQIAWLVRVLYMAEQAYRYMPKAGNNKKQYVLQMARQA